MESASERREVHVVLKTNETIIAYGGGGRCALRNGPYGLLGLKSDTIRYG